MPSLSGLAAVAVTILAFALLIVVHELGHFLAARACRMRVERFSVGFGPTLWAQRRGQTEWALSALPFGGYVRIAGMDPGQEVPPDDAGAYANQAPWRRFLVILAGPAMNYLSALVLGAALLASPLGLREPDPSATIGEVVAGGAAAAAGLRAGDRVLSADGRPVGSWEELVAAVVAHPGRAMALRVSRGGGEVELALTPADQGGRGRAGVAQATVQVAGLGPGAALARSVQVTHQRAAGVLGGLAQVVRGQQRAELRGPVGILQEMTRSARSGAGEFLSMVWFISVVLALFNLLPVPALDGGRLVFLCIELVTRRRVNQRIEGIVHMVGFVALLALVLAVTPFDLLRVVRAIFPG